MRTIHVWRYPIVELLVPIGYGRAYGHPSRVVFVADPRAIYGTPLSYDDFVTGPSDYDVPSDEIYCPCGVTLPWDGDAGDLLRRIDDHCKATPGHPMPVRSEAF
jgi:hypothetical protein